MLSLFLLEVMYYFKNRKEIIVISILFLSFFIMAPLGLKPGQTNAASLGNVLFWLALLTSYCLVGNTLYSRERDAGRIEAFQLLPLAVEWLVLAKWFAFYVSVLLPVLVMMPLAQLLVGGSLEALPQAWLAAIAGGAALSAISALASVVMAGIGQGAGAILGLLVLPLAVPVMIFGCEYSRTGGIDHLAILAGIACFMVPLMCVAGGSSLRSAN